MLGRCHLCPGLPLVAALAFALSSGNAAELYSGHDAVFTGQSEQTAASPYLIELVISGPRVVHVGENLWFTATLTNRSGQVVAVPSARSQGWMYMGGEWWKIVDKSGKPLQFKPPVDLPFDNMRGAPALHDSDFVLLKPGEKIEYQHETLGDPSDKFIFPRRGAYFLSLSWKFCAPKVRPLANGTVGYSCGITSEVSQTVKQALLATPDFDVQSNLWTTSLK